MLVLNVDVVTAAVAQDNDDVHVRACVSAFVAAGRHVDAVLTGRATASTAAVASQRAPSSSTTASSAALRRAPTRPTTGPSD